MAENAPRKSRRLRLAALIVGGVVAAGALFGGGVLLGVNLPGTGQSQFPGAPGDFPGGDFPGGGPGPVRPGDDTGQTDTTQP